MAKKYFLNEEDEYCYTIERVKEIMKNEGLTELTVIEAKIQTQTGFFYCREVGEVGEVGESCGKQCEDYQPNNGKNGRCKHYRNIYGPTDNERTIKLK